MDSVERREEFIRTRCFLRKTQKKISDLLGVSVHAVRSYEQGWRPVPAHVERDMLFLLVAKKKKPQPKPCWILKSCKKETMQQCPAFEFQLGKLCWFINGTTCEGTIDNNWSVKIRKCRKCELLKPLLLEK